MPRVLHDGTVFYDPRSRTFSVVTSELVESHSLAEALQHPQWKTAMIEEYEALLQNQTWRLVPPEPGQNMVDCKWVYKLKRHSDGSIE